MKKINKTNSLIFGLIALLAFGLAQNINAAQATSLTAINTKGEIIVAVTGARLRSQPSLNSKVVGSSKLGEVLPVISQKGNWYQVSLANGRSAWISGTIVKDFDESRRGLIYQEFADKYLNRKELDFNTASEAFGFLSMARNKVENRKVQAVLELKRFRMMAKALDKIPFDVNPYDEKGDSVYKNFLNANTSEITYSEPAGMWLVEADALWKLREKYSDLPIADDIAWEAANTMLPGECEGFIGCHFPLMVMTDGRYLKYYPNGKYSNRSLKVITESLNSMAGNDGSIYEQLYDDVERKEFNQSVKELREILSKVTNPERQRALNLLNQVEKKYSK